MKLLAVMLTGCLLAAALGGWILASGEEATQASPGVTIGVDADPTGNTATSLGTIDPCISVSNGATFDVDIFIKDAADLQMWHVILRYDSSAINVVDRNVYMFLASNAGSDVGDLSFGDSGLSGAYDLLARDAAEEPGAHETGSGVLARLTLKAVAPGLTTAMVEDPFLFPFHSVDSTSNAWIAVDQSCPGEPPPTSTATPTPWPTPTITPSPTTTATPTSGTPTGTPTPTPSPTATPTPPSPSMAWTYSCYLGASQPTEDALAAISGDVLAAYRLRPDQAYDRWFPGRADVNTLTVLNPYEALFLLMASDAIWPQEPWGESPTSVDLVFGWNSVCYTGQTKDAETATEGIADRFAVAYTLAPGPIWKRFVPGRPDVSNLSQLDSLTPVLILVTDENGALWLFDP